MKENYKYTYFDKSNVDTSCFYKIPKLMFTDERLKEISTEAKLLYGLMLDRMSLSIKNDWFDKDNRAYIYFSIEEVMKILRCKRNKAVETLKELDSETGVSLIEKKRQGQGKPTIIYVKNIVEPNQNQKLEKKLQEE